MRPNVASWKNIKFCRSVINNLKSWTSTVVYNFCSNLSFKYCKNLKLLACLAWAQRLFHDSVREKRHLRDRYLLSCFIYLLKKLEFWTIAMKLWRCFNVNYFILEETSFSKRAQFIMRPIFQKWEKNRFTHDCFQSLKIFKFFYIWCKF